MVVRDERAALAHQLRAGEAEPFWLCLYLLPLLVSLSWNYTVSDCEAGLAAFSAILVASVNGTCNSVQDQDEV